MNEGNDPIDALHFCPGKALELFGQELVTLILDGPQRSLLSSEKRE
jgi:hypothetical protein